MREPIRASAARVNPKLLLDENLSPYVAKVLATQDGVDACHIRDRNMLAASDRDVLERAYAEDRVLATVNVNDFVELANAREMHPGMILLDVGGVPREDQLRLLRRAISILRLEKDLVNRVLRIKDNDEFVFQELPKNR